ncbi:ImmA/IrrE family metallo-endopeptidase [Paenibacillus sp. LMG 31461]|uniref:ImmA/IrrE family metallo-endopeptidase n=1 Tax=Paenibacillus plantarum TaxID=2654975 RepID=A0ABX1XIR1_9BACL|nr:ImmA/IrrE family metallo-endopeptidase [Paenibacillus plantarum]NOU68342.1 ImmA/IrrE family metallo-endopeptidase [Paenibacillus plantarum]
MNLSLYRPTELEKWLEKEYRSIGIEYASDMDLDLISSIFDVEIRTYAGPSFAEWKEDEYSFIFLNAYLNEKQRREIFFHELCHPLQHVGQQEIMPKSFIELQEIQAKNFQHYAAMPSYLLEEFKSVSPSLLVKVIAEEFCLTERFVQHRLEQIQNRVQTAQYEEELIRRRNTKIVIDDDHVRRVMAELGPKQLEGA